MSLLRNGKLMNHIGSSLPSELNSDWDSYSIRRSGCSFKCWLSAWNYGIFVLIWFASGTNIVFAVLGRMRLQPLSPSFTYTEIDPTVAVIGLEILTFLLALVGFSVLVRQKVTILYLICILIGLLFVAHSGISILIFMYIESGSQDVAQMAKQAVMSYESDTRPVGQQQTSVDYAQEKYGCCGAMSYSDWQRHPNYTCYVESRLSPPSDAAAPYCGVPQSCCIPTGDSSTTPCATRDILKMTHNDIKQLIYTEGCYDAVWAEYRRNYVVISCLTLAIGFILVVCLLLTHTSVREIQIRNQKQQSAQKKRMQVHKIYNDL